MKTPDEFLIEDLEYWKQRCKLAEAIISTMCPEHGNTDNAKAEKEYAIFLKQNNFRNYEQ